MTFSFLVSIIIIIEIKTKVVNEEMKKRVIIFAALLSMCIQTGAFSVSNPAIKADNFIQLISHTSQYARIEGEIHDCKITDNSKVIFLNFGENFNTSLSALIYNTNIPAFIDAGIGQPEKYFKNKKVVVEGIIRISNGKPEIIINTPDQIKVID